MSRDFTVRLSHNVGKASDPDSSRFALGGVLIDGGAAIASDGRQLVATPVAAFYDDDKQPVESAELIAGKACQGVTKSKELTIRVNGRCEAKSKIFDRPEGRFPDWRKVIPRLPDIADAIAGKACVAVSLTPAVLRSMLAGMESPAEAGEAVTFVIPFDPKDNMCRSGPIGAYNASRALGVLMPCTTDAQNAYECAEKYNERADDLTRNATHDDSGKNFNGPQPGVNQDSAAA